VFGTKMYFDNKNNDIINQSKEFQNSALENAQKLEQAEKELKEKNVKLKNVSVIEDKITDYIHHQNNKVSNSEAQHLAEAIIKTSNKYDTVKWNILTSLVDSECAFDTKVVHKAASSRHIDVVGVTGVSTTTWLNELKREKIVTCRNDLLIPSKNIEACGYILNKYGAGHSTFKALAMYKSDCELGRRQASLVLKKAYDIKTKDYNV
jgi:hypothetical protein